MPGSNIGSVAGHVGSVQSLLETPELVEDAFGEAVEVGAAPPMEVAEGPGASLLLQLHKVKTARPSPAEGRRVA